MKEILKLVGVVVVATYSVRLIDAVGRKGVTAFQAAKAAKEAAQAAAKQNAAQAAAQSAGPEAAGPEAAQAAA